ncbi:hypothetical protein ACP70R_018023 [Stipagrostis hirtigluma subsp. patula]
MEATALSVGKAVLDGAVGYAKSIIKEEIALQLGVERDVVFIGDELEMMRSFLMTADEEHDKNKVMLTWVKQVREVAYNVEDNLMAFALQSDRKLIWWCIPRTLWQRRSIAKEMKELRAKVEDVSNRNLRYRLVKGSSSKPTVEDDQENLASVALFGINEAMQVAMEPEKSTMNLHQLVTSGVEDLRVIAVWGTSGDIGKISTIREVYDDIEVNRNFGCRAWIRLMQPFNPKEFLHNLVRQFYENSAEGTGVPQDGTTVGANVLMKMESMGLCDLIDVFNSKVNSDSYLVVIDDLSTIMEWDCVKKYFPAKKKSSRIIISTQQAEIASLCVEKPHQVSELKQLSSRQTLYVFHKKVTPPSNATGSISNAVTGTDENSVTSNNEIQEEDQKTKVASGDNLSTSSAGEKFDPCKTLALVDDVLVERSSEISEVVNRIGQPGDKQDCKVISVWGMGGLGKTTLIRSVYKSPELGGWKRAWVTALRTFDPAAVLRSIALQLEKQFQASQRQNDTQAWQHQKQIQEDPTVATMQLQKLVQYLSEVMHKEKCLIVIDDLSSTKEWDLIKENLAIAKRIIITTREKYIAQHCSREDTEIYNLQGLKDAVAFDLFIMKVFKGNIDFDLHPGMVDQAKVILKRCNGLPLAISAIGGLLANKPKNIVEWRKLNDHLSTELEINPELRMIREILMRSFDGLPYHLKSSFLYLSIFPEDHKIRRKRLVRRWVAEGYAKEMHSMNAEEVGDNYFAELLDRSMILAGKEVNHYSGKLPYCQLHDVIREICISKAMEENLVFTLDEKCSFRNTDGAIRHLAISSGWERDKNLLDTLELSHIRSLTVFGEWRSFILSTKMIFLRVLDLEGTVGLRDHHLSHIGEFHHLRFLSLRGCKGIFQLPDSLGNLSQLQTLDVKGTWIWRLPTTITNLQMLRHLRTGPLLKTSDEESLIMAFHSRRFMAEAHRRGEWYCVLEALRQSRGGMMDDNTASNISTRMKMKFRRCADNHKRMYSQWRRFCQVFKSPHLIEANLAHWSMDGPHVLEDGLSRRDAFNIYRFLNMCNKHFASKGSVRIPRGTGKLKALQALGVVNVSWKQGIDTFKELMELKQLRKLQVKGVYSENSEAFWSAISCHNQLRSLSVQEKLAAQESDLFMGWDLSPQDRQGEHGLDHCLGKYFSPPKGLECLKLNGKLSNVTKWIHQLQNLSKLQLEGTYLNQTGIEAIGTLPNLAVLQLLAQSYQEDQLNFQGQSFPCLVLLELSLGAKVVGFGEQAMPKLELLLVDDCRDLKEFSGLLYLTSLREIRLGKYKFQNLKEIVDRHLSGHSVRVTSM